PEKHTLRILMYEIKLTDVILQGSSFCNSGFHHQMQTCSIQSVNPHDFNVTQLNYEKHTLRILMYENTIRDTGQET
ncbi:5'-methylthioadenosine/S-adenosylhomocysteine nucleosidase, partial [Dissostichus eleginoides]